MRVIVGVDGSGYAASALKWALEEARLRDEELLAVYVYTSPVPYYPPEVFPTAAAERLAADARQDAREELDQALTEAIKDTEGVRVTPKAIENPRPAVALIELATPDDLLVVGSRGRGGFKGLVLGSVSQQCVQHAPCPVTVVRPPATS